MMNNLDKVFERNRITKQGIDAMITNYLKLERELAEARDQREKMVNALHSICEYWNQDRNDTAMFDACWYALNTAEKVLKECGE